VIAYELPDDCGPALADLRRDPPRTPPALAEVRRRVVLASAASQWARGRLSLARAALLAGVHRSVVRRVAREVRP